jgi:hypothetical protein
MSESTSVTLQKKHLYVISGVIVLLFIILLLNQNQDSAKTDSNSPAPTPTETIYVPTQGSVYNLNDDAQDQLEEIRAQNCELSRELMLQSLDLSRQANELDWASEGFDNFDQVQNLRNQSINLMIKSQELSNDC